MLVRRGLREECLEKMTSVALEELTRYYNQKRFPDDYARIMKIIKKKEDEQKKERKFRLILSKKFIIKL